MELHQEFQKESIVYDEKTINTNDEDIIFQVSDRQNKIL